MKRREYLGCPTDPETWYAVKCADCLYSAKNENGGHDHCMNYDEWDDEGEDTFFDQSDIDMVKSMNDIELRQAIKEAAREIQALRDSRGEQEADAVIEEGTT